MTGDFKNLIEHFRKHQDSVLTISSISEELDMRYESLRESLTDVGDDKSIYDLGNDRYMFSTDRILVSFEIFRGIAPNITLDEFKQYKDETHILVRMSRDREVGASFAKGPDEPEGRKARGNQLSF